MKQHIMLPKSTLKAFSEDKQIHWLVLNNNEIHTGRARSFNTKEDYFPYESENYLSTEIESRIGALRKALSNFERIPESLFLHQNITEQIIRIFIAQYSRLSKTVEIARSSSIFANLFHIPLQFYSPLHSQSNARQAVLDDVYRDISSNMLKDYETNIIIIPKESRKYSFLLTSSHFTPFNTWLILVLSPYSGIVLLPRTENKHLLNGNILQHFAAESENDVFLINDAAIKHERTLRTDPMVIGLLSQLKKTKDKIKLQTEKL